MIRYRIVQILLLPISLLYGIGIWIRNGLYKQELLNSVSYNLPVISVGNMSIGGTGKSPHIEYLIRFLSPYLQISTLSRGYGRKTKGFRWVQRTDQATNSGDEPLQFKQKFPEIPVAVCENRVLGVVQMLKERPDIKTVLLDDAFQHRSIDPGMNILLTEYSRPYSSDWLLPSGRLREWKSGRHRADMVIVSKCPEHITQEERETIIKDLDLKSNVPVFFTKYKYLNPYFIHDRDIQLELTDNSEVMLVSGIANTDYLLSYLEHQIKGYKTLEFEDHHFFSKYEISQIHRAFENFGEQEKVILTTEKDATRLLQHQDYLIEHRLPVFVLPVEVEFLFDQEESFRETIRDFLLSFET